MGKLTKTATEFAAVFLSTLAHGGKFASEQQVSDRLQICNSCPFFLPRENKCNHCRCHLGDLKQKWLSNLVNKLAHKQSACPMGKWGPIEED